MIVIKRIIIETIGLFPIFGLKFFFDFLNLIHIMGYSICIACLNQDSLENLFVIFCQQKVDNTNSTPVSINLVL